MAKRFAQSRRTPQGKKNTQQQNDRMFILYIYIHSIYLFNYKQCIIHTWFHVVSTSFELLIWFEILNLSRLAGIIWPVDRGNHPPDLLVRILGNLGEEQFVEPSKGNLTWKNQVHSSIKCEFFQSVAVISFCWWSGSWTANNTFLYLEPENWYAKVGDAVVVTIRYSPARGIVVGISGQNGKTNRFQWNDQERLMRQNVFATSILIFIKKHQKTPDWRSRRYTLNDKTI